MAGLVLGMHGGGGSCVRVARDGVSTRAAYRLTWVRQPTAPGTSNWQAHLLLRQSAWSSAVRRSCSLGTSRGDVVCSLLEVSEKFGERKCFRPSWTWQSVTQNLRRARNTLLFPTAPSLSPAYPHYHAMLVIISVPRGIRGVFFASGTFTNSKEYG